jgi:hypothetical protein
MPQISCIGLKCLELLICITNVYKHTQAYYMKLAKKYKHCTKKVLKKP